MRHLLWRCDEHRGPDADFPAMRADLGHVAVRFWPVSQREAPGASQAAQGGSARSGRSCFFAERKQVSPSFGSVRIRERGEDAEDAAGPAIAARQVTKLQREHARVLVPPVTGNAKIPDRLHPVARSMLATLQTEDGKAAYRRRQAIVEPVFAQIKHNRGITRLLRRGRAAVQAEIDLIATTHNLLKLRTTLQTV